MDSMQADPNRLAIARELLLSPNELDNAGLRAALAITLAHRVDYADLFFQSTRRENWRLEAGIVQGCDFSLSQGVGVRAVAGERSALAYAHEISARSLAEAATTARTIAAAGGGTAPARLRGRCHPVRYGADDPLGSLDAAAKVALLARVERMARALDTRVVGVMVHLFGEREVVLVARHDGLLAADVRPLARVKVSIIARQGALRVRAGACVGLRGGYEHFSDAVLADIAAHAVKAALAKLSARAAPAGTMSVVLAPGWPGILLHEAIGHGLEGDFNRTGVSAFAGRIGERVAARGVTVVDDGTLPGHCGSLNMDDEGTPSGCTTLIEDGILTGYIQDSLNARLMGAALTGNARRMSFAHRPLPRMTNTCMRVGACDPGEIVASVKDGIYVANLGGGQVDITSGKFVFEVSEGYRIENGSLTHPIHDVTLIGNGPDILRRVSMIGNDLTLDPGIGLCDKYGQNLPIGVGQPTLRIDRVTVGGTR